MAALFALAAVRAGGGAAGRSRRFALARLAGRWRHRGWSLDPGAQVGQRFAVLRGQLLRRHDFQRLGRCAFDRQVRTRKKRTQGSISADYLHGSTTYSLGFIQSHEPDYRANTGFFSVSQSMFGDLTTISFGYTRGWDQGWARIAILTDAMQTADALRPGSAMRSPQLAGEHLPDPDAQPAHEPERRGPRRERTVTCKAHIARRAT